MSNRPSVAPPVDPGAQAREALDECHRAVEPALAHANAASMQALDAAERIVRARARRRPGAPDANITGAFAPYRAAVGGGPRR